jgi:hypothetical protein
MLVCQILNFLRFLLPFWAYLKCIAHKVWAPRKVKGWKLYELVEAKGQIGYIGGRRLTGAFVIKDIRSGKALAEVTPRKLLRLARCVHGWIITRFPCSHLTGKENGASSPS